MQGGLAAAVFPRGEEVVDVFAVHTAVVVHVGGWVALFPGVEEGLDVGTVDAAVLVEVGGAWDGEDEEGGAVGRRCRKGW